MAELAVEVVIEAVVIEAVVVEAVVVEVVAGGGRLRNEALKFCATRR